MHSTSSWSGGARSQTELDGWRNYSAALTIEDPFESFTISHTSCVVDTTTVFDANLLSPTPRLPRPGVLELGTRAIREMSGEEL
jgi:hypothetical protein